MKQTLSLDDKELKGSLIHCPKCDARTSNRSLACFKCGRAIRANVQFQEVRSKFNSLLDLFTDREIEFLVESFINEEIKFKKRNEKLFFVNQAA